MKAVLTICCVAIVLVCLTVQRTVGEVTFIPGENSVKVIIDGSHITTYLYDSELSKPVLYPVYTPRGIAVNRSFPFAELEGESRDHPHHTGVFFTVDEVNGNKFWGNTGESPKIRHVEFTTISRGKTEGTLGSVLHWIGTDGATLLMEKRTMTFIPGSDRTSIDFTITLTAVNSTVTFRDTKEGMFAIRLAHWLKEKGGTGHYLSSRGGTSANDIWGRRAEWVRIEGNRGGSIAGVVIMNHPSSVNYPTYWHARDYGLFAANPLGQYVFQESTGMENPERFDLTLNPGESTLFMFRMIVYDGPKTADEIENQYFEYINKK